MDLPVGELPSHPLVREARVILIDGRSGAGKTALAARIAAVRSASGEEVQLLHVEDLYPGWDGLRDGSRRVAQALTEGHYRTYDWHARRFRSEQHPLTRARALIIEGCGALTPQNLAAAREWERSATIDGHRGVLGVWVACDARLRRERALDRDGDTYAPHWQRWAAQENSHIVEHRPAELAQIRTRTDVGATASGPSTET